MEQISKELMDILACPKCKMPVKPENNALKCTNKSCGLSYPVRNGIPIMLVDEADKHTQTRSSTN